MLKNSGTAPKRKIGSRLDNIARLTAEASDTISNWTAFWILLAICLGFSALNWLDLGSFWGDGPSWLFQTARAYGGELPYRDFSLSYPPFSIWLFQFIYWVLGPTFLAAQILVDILGISIVLLTYMISTRIMPRSLALAAGILVACVSASGGSSFELFTLQIYTPALLPGVIGLQLMTIGMIDRHRQGRWTRGTALLTAIGCSIAILSKPEFMAGAIACLIAGCFLAICDQRKSGTVSLGRIWAVAAAPIFGCAIAGSLLFALGLTVGTEKLIFGLSGQGMAAIACPWWPTGLGLFGALGSLGEAGAILALMTLFRFGDLSRTYGRRYILALVLAAIGTGIFILYLPIASQGYSSTAIRDIGSMTARWGFGLSNIINFSSYLFTRRNILLPVMWSNIVISIVLSIRKFSLRARGSKIEDALYLVMLIACALSARQLFGDYFESLTSVAIAAHVFLIILLVAFLYYAITWVCNIGGATNNRGAGIAILVTILVVGSYSGLRAAVSTIMELRAGYQPLHTPAGTVNLNDPASVAIYSFIRDHSGPGETIVDIGSNDVQPNYVGGLNLYGGGVNFALRRTSPIFSVAFSALKPPDLILNDDLMRFRATLPKFVIGANPLNAQYGLINAWNGCSFPSLIWAPHIENFEKNKLFPLIKYIRSNYTKVFQIDRWAVFARE